MKTLELKIPPLVWVLFCAISIWACSIWLPSFGFRLPWGSYLALSFAFLGIATALSGIYSFRQSQTTVNPLAPEQATTLVIAGPYRFTRNPMYVGMALLLISCCLGCQNLCGFIFVAFYVAVITELQIKPEERFLEELFGQEYEEYKKRVPRWLGRLSLA